MKDKYFIDTNIFVYSFDRQNDNKRQKANELIKTAVIDHSGCISLHVIQEFINVATKKFDTPISIADCQKYLRNILSPICRVFTSLELYYKSLDVMERWQYSIYDSLIIAAALQTECKYLYSENLQHKQKIQDITIINPFL